MQDGNSFLLQIRLNFIVDRTSGTDKKPQYLSRWKGVPPEVPLREFPYNAVVELVNPVADTQGEAPFHGVIVRAAIHIEQHGDAVFHGVVEVLHHQPAGAHRVFPADGLHGLMARIFPGADGQHRVF